MPGDVSSAALRRASGKPVAPDTSFPPSSYFRRTCPAPQPPGRLLRPPRGARGALRQK